MQDKLGEEFTGMITGVTTFGIFVQLDQLFVEGLVHVTELGTDYFQYDDARHELRGERTGKRYQLTDRVNVQVARVDLESRKIDLRLVLEAGAAPIGGSGGKNGTRGGNGEQDNAAPGKRKGGGKSMVKPAPKTQSRHEPKAGESASRPSNGARSKAGASPAAKPVSKNGKKKR